MMIHWRAFIITWLCALSGLVYAATPQFPVASFDIASIKPSGPDSGLTRIILQPGALRATSAPVTLLIQFAYGLQDLQLIGSRGWMTSELFDIQAKVSDGSIRTAEHFKIMLRSLLADPFRLLIHREQRVLPVYALMLVNPDRSLGPKLNASNGDCREPTPTATTANADTDQRPFCRVRIVDGQMISTGAALSDALMLLSEIAGRQVVDRTGLMGGFNYDLTWAASDHGRPTDSPSRGIDTNGPSFFTALREQLGLKLEATRAPVGVVVIDHVERPTPD